MELLQQHPPPIDYQARREHADQVAAFAAAVDVARRVHPSARLHVLLVRQLWERFTGGDIAYAPHPLSIDTATAAYADYRCQLSVRDADLLHVAHQWLNSNLRTTGPATWSPSAPPEPEWPDIRALFVPDHGNSKRS